MSAGGFGDGLSLSIISINKGVAAMSASQAHSDYVKACLPPEVKDSLPQYNQVDVGDISPIPWFKTFRETLIVRSIPSVSTVAQSVKRYSANISRVDLSNSQSLLKHRITIWRQQVEVRQKQLRNEFHSGICGCRATALRNASSVKLSLMGAGSTDENKVSMLGGHKTRLQSALADSAELATTALESSPSDKRATIPDLILSDRGNNIDYIDRNRIIDPVKTESQRRVATWTLEDIKTFLERYAIHPKNFKRIAAHFSDKWESDCVDLYYRMKIALNLKRFSYASSTVESRRRSSVTSGGQKNLNQIVIDEALAMLRPVASFGGMIPDHNSVEYSRISRDDSIHIPAQSTDEDEDRKYMIDCIQYIFAHFKSMLPAVNPNTPVADPLAVHPGHFPEVQSSEAVSRPGHPFAIPLGYQ
jgi:hypothetical protein